MSWLFSQALVVEYLQATCLAGEQYVPSNGSPTPLAYLQPDRTTAFSRLSQSGVTFRPLTDALGAGLLTWFRVDSLARTSAPLEVARALTESAAECGATWRGSLARFDPGSCTWRTAQPSLLGDSEECSVTWPRSGMTAGGRCWELQMSVPPIGASGFGLWLGTPTAQMTKRSARFVHAWPTPTARLGDRRGMPGVATAAQRYAQGRRNLEDAVAMWPTPTAALHRSGGSDCTAWPTPQRIDSDFWQMKQGTAQARIGKRQVTLAVLGRSGLLTPTTEPSGGSLNPTWVEWLMGWPLGWTDLEPSATARCRSAQRRLGAC